MLISRSQKPSCLLGPTAQHALLLCTQYLTALFPTLTTVRRFSHCPRPYPTMFLPELLSIPLFPRWFSSHPSTSEAEICYSRHMIYSCLTHDPSTRPCFIAHITIHSSLSCLSPSLAWRFHGCLFQGCPGTMLKDCSAHLPLSRQDPTTDKWQSPDSKPACLRQMKV